MGEPLKIGGKANRYPRFADKAVFDRNLDEAGVGAQHKNGLSSQRGRTTIIYRNGKKIYVRKDGTVLNPDEIRAGRRMKMSVYEFLEQSGGITHA